MNDSVQVRQSGARHRAETLICHRAGIEKAIKLIRQNPGDKHDWLSLAQAACMSKYHFLRVFRMVTGVNPHHFLIAVRIELAKKLLLQTSFVIDEICARTGYASLGTFVRIFKALVGITPGEFRHLAADMTPAYFRELVDRPLHRRPLPDSGDCINISIEIPAWFSGVILVWLLKLPLQTAVFAAGAPANQSQTITFSIPSLCSGAKLFGVGLPDENMTNPGRYFIPDEHMPVCQPVAGQSGGNGSPDPSVFTLRTPSFFDPPILPCIPHLLGNCALDGR